MGIMNEVAKLLGVRLGMPFNIVAFDPISGVIHAEHEPYRLNELGLVGTGDVDPNELNDMLKGLLTGVLIPERITDYSTEQLQQLCYVDENNIMYFTTDMENVYGDDWDDRPFRYNADPPYDKFVSRKVCFEKNWDVESANDAIADYCAYDINKGAIPWLYHEDAGALMGGTSYPDCITWLRKAGLKWGELRD